MASLRQELDGSVLEGQISELEDKLDVAVSENDRLQRNIKELEKWKQKLEKESKILWRMIFALLICRWSTSQSVTRG